MSRNGIYALVSIALTLCAIPGFATDVVLVGRIGGKAIVVIDNGAPRTLLPGQKTAEGVTLLAIDKNAASFEIDGKKRLLRIGQQVYTAPKRGKPSVTLQADARGQFIALGSINGRSVRFLVDTGATVIALPPAEAQRLGIDYLRGQRGRMQTANGAIDVYRVKLDSVRVGDIEASNVDAVVSASNNMGPILLGTSFLNRVEMHRDGQIMTLTKRY